MINEGIEEVERVSSQSDFEAFLAENGFQHRSKGTFFSEQLQQFLYRKSEAMFNSKSVAMQALKTYREMTKQGILHPSTTWSVYQRDNGNFVVYAASPKLSQDDEYFQEERWQQTLPKDRHSLLAARLGFDSDALYEDAMDDKNSILNHLDPMEIQHRQNWGYDPDHDEFYVIDVQAVMFDGAEQFREDHQKAVEIEEAEIDTSIQRL